MGDSRLGHPTIRINANYLQDLFKVYPTEAVESSKADEEFVTSRHSIKTINCNPQQAVDLVRSGYTDRELILFAYSKVQQIFGPGHSAEFRIYRNIPGWVGQRLHILDIN